MKILTVVGARPQFIKAATVSRAAGSRDGVEEILVHTGQHYDDNMSDVFFDELEIPRPDFNLNIGSGSHGEQTGKMLREIEKVLLQESPDWTLVYGDTNSTLAGTLASVKLGIPVAHVEAGLRSFNQYQPEEINRAATDAVAQLLFPPTKGAEALLLAAGHASEHVINVGDVMYDAALFYGAKADAASEALGRCDLKPGGYILATVHRAENTDDTGRLRAIFEALGRVAADIPVVLPLHPRTRAVLIAEGLLEAAMAQCTIIEPVGYLDMVALEKNAAKIVTDSGGVQKEAFFYGVPCITLRDETEWVELVEGGWNLLLSPGNAGGLVEAILAPFEAPRKADNLFGDGAAAEKIVTALLTDTRSP